VQRVAAAAVASTIATPFVATTSRAETSPGRFAVSTDPTDDVLFMSATKVAQYVREKKVSSVEITRGCIERIGKVNPFINAVVMTSFQRALT